MNPTGDACEDRSRHGPALAATVTCPHCETAHAGVAAFPRREWTCVRCEALLYPWWRRMRSNTWATVLSLAALVHYPLAILIPILVVEEVGLARDVNIIDGVVSLLGGGRPFVGIIVVCFSIILPLGKIVTMMLLATKGVIQHSKHRERLFHIVEITGRWGMLDVFLVGILIAMVKMDMVQMKAGAGLLAFTICVVLSLLSAAFFDPQSIWEEAE